MKTQTKAASAVKENGGGCHADLSHNVIMSAKIGQILPIIAIPCIPGDTMKVHSSQFTRTLPLSVPSYVNLYYRTLSVFVPYHQVMPGAESFFDDQKRFRGVTNRFPTIDVGTIYDALCLDDVFSDADNTATEPDFEVNVLQPEKRKLNARGHYVVKVLALLGYNLPFVYDHDTKTYAGTEVTSSNEELSALPLLAFAHAYNSYLSYAPNYNESQLSQLLENFHRGVNYYFHAEDLLLVLTSILLTYNDSFYSCAWHDAASSTPHTTLANKLFQSQTPEEIQQALSQYPWLDDAKGAKFDVDADGINAESVRMMLRFDKYLRRSNFSGSKDIEQIYSRLGIKIEDYYTRYPHYITESGDRVQIGDVTATADSGGVPVGGYAGKVIASGDASFKYHCSDYGMLFTFAWYAPKVSYYKGLDKEVLRIKPLDFYTPELDDGVMSAVEVPEIDCGGSTITLRETFGYMPLYSQYLFHQDRIVGDFRRFSGFSAWHFGRTDMTNVSAQSDKLIYMPNHGTEFERIFYVDDPNLVDVDSLYLTIRNDVDAYRPMKDYTGKADLGYGDIDVDVNGTTIS